MTSRNCLHGFKIAVIALAIIDLVWNIYKFIIFVVFELVIVIIYALMSTKKPPRSHEHMRTTVPLRQTTVPMRTTV
ncbi:CLUMA_CG001720, isoform A [Clunio marinus]|uniref:CLUMA_CG001720, isoform A n=1 Tax=Clunio marinus TaxID=568069 RepID=A0A1J1HN87_9DIPT|nr:CLUMA_CG001720, isoform A [Clunio marinus]